MSDIDDLIHHMSLLRVKTMSSDSSSDVTPPPPPPPPPPVVNASLNVECNKESKLRRSNADDDGLTKELKRLDQVSELLSRQLNRIHLMPDVDNIQLDDSNGEEAIDFEQCDNCSESSSLIYDREKSNNNNSDDNSEYETLSVLEELFIHAGASSHVPSTIENNIQVVNISDELKRLTANELLMNLDADDEDETISLASSLGDSIYTSPAARSPDDDVNRKEGIFIRRRRRGHSSDVAADKEHFVETVLLETNFCPSDTTHTAAAAASSSSIDDKISSVKKLSPGRRSRTVLASERSYQKYTSLVNQLLDDNNHSSSCVSRRLFEDKSTGSDIAEEDVGSQVDTATMESNPKPTVTMEDLLNQLKEEGYALVSTKTEVIAAIAYLRLQVEERQQELQREIERRAVLKEKQLQEAEDLFKEQLSSCKFRKIFKVQDVKPCECIKSDATPLLSVTTASKSSHSKIEARLEKSFSELEDESSTSEISALTCHATNQKVRSVVQTTEKSSKDKNNEVQVKTASWRKKKIFHIASGEMIVEILLLLLVLHYVTGLEQQPELER